MAGIASAPHDGMGMPGLLGDPAHAGGHLAGCGDTGRGTDPARRDAPLPADGAGPGPRRGVKRPHWGQRFLLLRLRDRGWCGDAAGADADLSPPPPVLLGSDLIELRGLRPARLSAASVSLPGARLSRDAGAGQGPGHKRGPSPSSNIPPGPHRNPHLPVSPVPSTGKWRFVVPWADFISL